MRTDANSWRSVTAHQWGVFAVVTAAWLFDTLGQRLFTLTRIAALSTLMHAPPESLRVQGIAKVSTALFLVGWGIGGLAIGALGDRFGPTRLLNISVALYSVFSALTAICQNTVQFALLRILTGIGIGGVFGLAVTIVSLSVNGRIRTLMLGLLQVISIFGNIGAALINMAVDAFSAGSRGSFGESWRWSYAIAAFPIILVIGAFWHVAEPREWLQLRDSKALRGSVFGPYGELLRDRTERRHLLIGTLLASSGIMGLWAVGEYAVDLQQVVFARYFYGQPAISGISVQVARAINRAFLLQMSGAALGMLGFTFLAERIGRRPAFALGFIAAYVVTLLVFWRLDSPAEACWMMPLMGACQYCVLAGYAIYLPELFGTRTRATGVSFAYNVGRFGAAAASFGSAYLASALFGEYPSPAPLRYSAMTLCSIFLVGVAVAWIAPETCERSADCGKGGQP